MQLKLVANGVEQIPQLVREGVHGPRLIDDKRYVAEKLALRRRRRGGHAPSTIVTIRPGGAVCVLCTRPSLRGSTGERAGERQEGDGEGSVEVGCEGMLGRMVEVEEEGRGGV